MRNHAIALALCLPLAMYAACYSPTAASNSTDAASVDGPNGADAELKITWPVRYVPADSVSSVGSVDLTLSLPPGVTAIWDLSTGKISANGSQVGEAPAAVAAAQTGGPTLQIVRLRGLKIAGGTVELRGVGPAVIVADLIVIDASATLSVNANAGVAGVNTGVGNGGDGSGRGGGGGGFGTAGGAAGTGAGGSAYSIATTLRGGSHGGRDPQCAAGATSFGGAGGGALLLYARTSIVLLGTISANGAGGIAGNQCTPSLYGEGGGGGGSGGAIVLQSPLIEAGDGSVRGVLLATGGGGGGGGPGLTGLGELPGRDGGAGMATGGSGGNGAIYAGKGGNGGGGSLGASSPGDGAAGVQYSSGNMGYGGHGGGGGAAGYIELRTRSTPSPRSAPLATIVTDGP